MSAGIIGLGGLVTFRSASTAERYCVHLLLKFISVPCYKHYHTIRCIRSSTVIRCSYLCEFLAHLNSAGITVYLSIFERNNDFKITNISVFQVQHDEHHPSTQAYKYRLCINTAQYRSACFVASYSTKTTNHHRGTSDVNHSLCDFVIIFFVGLAN